MKKHFPPTEFPTNGTSPPTSDAAINEIERRLTNQQKHVPATSVEYDYSEDKRTASVRVVLWGTPEDVMQYLVARSRTNGASDGAPE